jgi:hypothetical protein
MTARLTDRLSASIQSRLVRSGDSEAGMTTAEYAVGTVAAGCAGTILYKVTTSDQFLQIVKGLIFKALKLPMF